MSGFRDPLDLSGILPRHKLWSPPEPEENTAVEEPSGPKFLNPVLLGTWKGTERFSTCTDLDVKRIIKWDVNGYYRDLNVHTDATRRELMQAYLMVDGQSSPRLTYCFKQLLNPEIRKAYDSTPLGEKFLDEYTQDDLKKSAAREAFQRRTAGESITPEEVLNEWGFEMEEGEPPADLPKPKPSYNFEYKYWAWQTSDYMQDEKKIAEWQSAIVSAANELGILREVAVGITGSTENACRIETSKDGHPIIYVSENAEITKELALEALRAVVALNPV